MKTHLKMNVPSFGFLVVEDETVAAIDLECILEELGHSVADVSIVPALAEKALKEKAHCIDAVLLGSHQVGISSLPLANSLIRRGLPVVITSRRPVAELRALGFEAPVLAKPFRSEDVARMAAALADRQVVPAA